MGETPGYISATVQLMTGNLTLTGKLLSITSISPTLWTSAMLVATVTLLPTSLTCQGTTQVMAIITVMPTLVITSGAPSTTPWRGTSTPSPPPSTPATEVADTGIAVTGEAARSMLSMLASQ